MMVDGCGTREIVSRILARGQVVLVVGPGDDGGADEHERQDLLALVQDSPQEEPGLVRQGTCKGALVKGRDAVRVDATVMRLPPHIFTIATTTHLESVSLPIPIRMNYG